MLRIFLVCMEKQQHRLPGAFLACEQMHSRGIYSFARPELSAFRFMS